MRCSFHRHHPTTSQTRVSQSLRTSSAFASVDDSNFQGHSSERICRFVGWLVVVVLLTPDTTQKWIKSICFAVFHSRLIIIIINPLTFIALAHSSSSSPANFLFFNRQIAPTTQQRLPCHSRSFSLSSVDAASPAHLLISQLIMETDVLFKMMRWDEVALWEVARERHCEKRKINILKVNFSLQHQHVEPQPTRDLAPLFVSAEASERSFKAQWGKTEKVKKKKILRLEEGKNSIFTWLDSPQKLEGREKKLPTECHALCVWRWSSLIENFPPEKALPQSTAGDDEEAAARELNMKIQVKLFLFSLLLPFCSLSQLR